MTNAHRPTWKPKLAEGESNLLRDVGSKTVYTQSLPAFTKLKHRQLGQNTESEVQKRDMKAELLEREARASRKRKLGVEHDESVDLLSIEAAATKRPKKNSRRFSLDADDDDDEDSDNNNDSDNEVNNETKEKDPINSNNNEEDDSEDSDLDSDSDSDDDEELLRQELAKIRKEREDAAAKQAREAEEAILAEKAEAAMAGPSESGLGGISNSFTVQKSWTSDTVFKNQAKYSTEEKKFVNDTVRNPFHRKFLSKYMK